MLKLEGLRVQYGEFTAVSSASLTVPPGCIVSVIGANGAGKSSLLNAAAGLLKPASGRVFLGEEDVTSLPAEEHVKRGLCLVPEGGRCFTRMSVEDNLLIGSFHNNARSRARDSLEKIYSLFPVLAEKRKDPAGSLSGGQRQMTAIGRALMSCPACILFDELSLGLSPMVIQEIYDQILRINREEKTSIVLVEQDTDRAMSVSRICYVMRQGRVVLSGDPVLLTREVIRDAYFGTGEQERKFTDHSYDN